VVSIESDEAAASRISVTAGAGVVSVEQRGRAAVGMIMILPVSIAQGGFAVPIVKANFAQHALDLFAQSFGDNRGVAFAARDATNVRRVDIELHRNALVDTAKYGERGERRRDIIGLVTIHDFL
jgi:hypothetical protein